MKVLWITIMVLPEACNAMGLKPSVLGGWMQSAASELVKNPDIELAVAATYSGRQYRKAQVGRITYYLLPCKNPSRYDARLKYYWNQVRQDFKPDVVHLHGTEFPLGLAYVDACGSKRVVVSIQGLVGECAKNYHNGMTKWEVVSNTTLHDLLLGTIRGRQRDFARRGKYEKMLLSKIDNVVGRTSWDRSLTESIRPERHYFFCNETLRPQFYESRWRYGDCVPHTIFVVSQANYPLKGLHQLLKAMPMVLQQYPDTQVRVAGDKVMPTDRLHNMAYAKYLRKLIKKNRLEGHITFLGALAAGQMRDEMLRANMYVLPSTIENSSNSLGEAQLMGVPCVAARVGGVSDMVPDEMCGTLYEFDNIEGMAQSICSTFEQSCRFDNTEMRRMAQERHNPEINRNQLIEIYHKVRGII